MKLTEQKRNGWLVGLCLLLALTLGPHTQRQADAPLARPAGTRLAQLAQQQPLSFERAHGPVSFQARGAGYRLGLTESGAWLELRATASDSDHRARRAARRANYTKPPTLPRATVLRLELPGAQPHPRLEALDALPGVSNYLLGADARHWRTGVPRYARVAYRGVYPGVDLVFYGRQQELEYDFVVAPGADPRGIRLRFTSAQDLTLAADGALRVQMGDAEIVQHAPIVYQETINGRTNVVGRYSLTSANEVGFALDAFDPCLPLVIDPVLSYASYFGGGGDAGLAIAADAAGNVYVTGSTTALDFPLRNPAQPSPGGGTDLFVSKFNAAGLPVYATYLGGSGSDFGYGITADAEGNAYVTGSTDSANFAVTPGAFKTRLADFAINAFVAKLDANGVLRYATFLGGSDFDQAYSIAVDGARNAYVTGYAGSVDFPTTPGTLKPRASSTDFADDGFVTKLNPAGTALVWSTFLGGTNSDEGNAIVVDGAGNSFVAGDTFSTDLPTTPGAAQPVKRGSTEEDTFVARLNATGTTLSYATYFGGNGNELGFGIAVDGAGQASVVGYTASTDLTTTPNGLQRSYGGGTFDGFGLRLDALGGLLYATYFGGGGNDQAYSVALDAAGNAWVSGLSDSSNLPVSAPLQAAIGGSGVFQSANGAGSWRASGAGLLSVSVLALALDPGTSGTLYAGTNGAGVFKSVNGGETWSATATGLPNRPINALAVNPATPATLYAGINLAGIFKSTNGGGAWSAMNTGLTDPSILSIRALVIDRATPTTLYAGTSNGVFKSTDGAASWTRFSSVNGLPSSSIRAVAIDPATPQTLYAGTSVSGIGKSTNGGLSWSAINTGLSNRSIRALAVDPANPQTLYAGTLGGGVFKSSNGGGSWSAASTGLGDPNVVALALDPATPTTLYAATNSGVFKSLNGGAAWSAASGGLTALRPNALVVEARAPQTLYASASGGDAFVARVMPNGALGFATWFGGGGSESGNGIALDGAGNAYLTGGTSSANLPVTPGAFQAAPRNGGGVFIAKFSDAFACTLTCTATVPNAGTAGLPVAFNATAAGCSGATTQVWDFGDGAARLAQSNPAHVYFAAGSYTWTLAVLNNGAAACTQTGTVTVSGRALANVSAASFTGDELARDSIVAGFGANLATGSQAATSTPLPTTLAGATLRLTDSVGAARLAPLFFAAPGQINYLIPAETALGRVTATVNLGAADVALGSLTLVNVAPGLFTANADGRGVPAAVALRVRSGGAQSFELVARFDQATGRFVSVPLDLGPATDQVFLLLFGTGWRGRSALAGVNVKLGPPTGVDTEVSFAGAQGELAGLDQINAGPLPRALAGRGEVDLVLTVDGKAANAVRVSFR